MGYLLGGTLGLVIVDSTASCPSGHSHAGCVRLAEEELLLTLTCGEGTAAAHEALRETLIAVDTEDPRFRLWEGLRGADCRLRESRCGEASSVVAHCRGSSCWVGWVGEARFYHLRAGECIWRTLDHNLIQQLIDGNAPMQARHTGHPPWLTRALGRRYYAPQAPGEDRTVRPDVLEEPLELAPGDTLVLASGRSTSWIDGEQLAAMSVGLGPEALAEWVAAWATALGAPHRDALVVLRC